MQATRILVPSPETVDFAILGEQEKNERQDPGDAMLKKQHKEGQAKKGEKEKGNQEKSVNQLSLEDRFSTSRRWVWFLKIANKH